MRVTHEFRPGVPVYRCDTCGYERVGSRGRDAVAQHEAEAHRQKLQVRESSLLGPDGHPAVVEVKEEAVAAAAVEVVRYEFNERLRRGVSPATEEEID